MSMNLIFKVRKGNTHIDFPIPTTTEMTHRVLNASTDKERLAIILDYMELWDWEPEVIEEKIHFITSMMNDPTLELSNVKNLNQ